MSPLRLLLSVLSQADGGTAEGGATGSADERNTALISQTARRLSSLLPAESRPAPTGSAVATAESSSVDELVETFRGLAPEEQEVAQHVATTVAEAIQSRLVERVQVVA